MACRAALLPVGVMLLALQGPAASPPAASQEERANLVALAQEFLDSVAAKDIDLLERRLYREGQFVYVEDGESGQEISVTSSRDLMATLPDWEGRIREQLREPTVLIDGRIAVVWARYEHYADDALSHCGTDVFTFMKRGGRWILTAGSWTVERENCADRRPRAASGTR